MSNSRGKGPALTVLDAVETLSSIVDMDTEFNEVSTITAEELGLESEKVSARNVEWVRDQDIDTTIDQVKSIFSVIFDYVEGFYKKESQYLQNQKTVEEIKNIMFLVAEAAKKLDYYTALQKNGEKGTITELEEYKRIQDFYRKKIDQRIDESVLGKWIMGVAEATLLQDALADWKKRKVVAIQKTYVDLESIKSDHEYELLLIRKNDGAPFYSPQLIRNIKLVCDFGFLEQEVEQLDILKKIKFWREEAVCDSAADILHSIWDPIRIFYRFVNTGSEDVVVSALSKTVFALMMASNPNNQRRNLPAKSCSQYFSDFQLFLREVLSSREFQRILIYSSKEDNILEKTVLEIVEAICSTLFLNLHSLQKFSHRIDQILHRASVHAESRNIKQKKEGVLSNRLLHDYSALLYALKYHANGPLERDLELIGSDDTVGFDTLKQENLPNFWFDFYVGERQIKHLRFPCPILQERVDHADVSEEFKGFLFHLLRNAQKQNIIIFNLQDRLSWREIARSTLMERLQKSSLFSDILTVVTLDIDSDFYHQLGVYASLNNADSFMNEFYNCLNAPEGAYFFPEKVRNILFPEFIKSALKAVHQLFFSQKGELTHQERLQFISFFHILLQRKIIDHFQPNYFSFACKDGVDSSSMCTANFFIFNRLFNQEILSEAAQEYLNLLLYGAPLLIRERAMLPERFYRTLNVVEGIEAQKKRLGFTKFTEEAKEILKPLFDHPILQSHIDIPN